MERLRVQETPPKSQMYSLLMKPVDSGSGTSSNELVNSSYLPDNSS